MTAATTPAFEHALYRSLAGCLSLVDGPPKKRRNPGCAMPAYRVDPHDVAALALFLSSDSGAKCTGREYYVDAGWLGA